MLSVGGHHKLEHAVYIDNKTKLNSVLLQVFREDFTLCLILGDILNDPIVSDNRDITVSIYGSRDQYRSSTLSSMHLQIAEGHVLGQVSLQFIIIAVAWEIKLLTYKIPLSQVQL